MMLAEILKDPEGEPYDERTVRAVVALLQASKHRVHQGAANLVAANFLPDGRIERARALASEKGWPLAAVLAGLTIAEGE